MAHVLALVLERDSVASFWLVVSIARIAVLVPVTSVFHRTLRVGWGRGARRSEARGEE